MLESITLNHVFARVRTKPLQEGLSAVCLHHSNNIYSAVTIPREIRDSLTSVTNYMKQYSSSLKFI